MTPEQLARSGTEDGEQRALFAYAADRVNGRAFTPGRAAHVEPPELLWALLYAIPNGGKRSKTTAAMLKSTGTKAGFPDVGLPVARGGYFGLFIELKRQTKFSSKVGEIQSVWHTKLIEQGFYVEVCFGWLEAVATIESYLSEPQTDGRFETVPD